MGTFTRAGKEYDGPDKIPEPFASNAGLAKSFTKGWLRGIWQDTDVFKRYKQPGRQAAFEAGFKAARQQRRDSGEQVKG